jgi:hypothetical protein
VVVAAAEVDGGAARMRAGDGDVVGATPEGDVDMIHAGPLDEAGHVVGLEARELLGRLHRIGVRKEGRLATLVEELALRIARRVAHYVRRQRGSGGERDRGAVGEQQPQVVGRVAHDDRLAAEHRLARGVQDHVVQHVLHLLAALAEHRLVAEVLDALAVDVHHCVVPEVHLGVADLVHLVDDVADSVEGGHRLAGEHVVHREVVARLVELGLAGERIHHRLAAEIRRRVARLVEDRVALGIEGVDRARVGVERRRRSAGQVDDVQRVAAGFRFVEIFGVQDRPVGRGLHADQ